MYLNIVREFLYNTKQIGRKAALIPHSNCLLNHHFSPPLVHVRSKNGASQKYNLLDILSLTTSTLSNSNTVLLCTKKPFPN